MASITALRVLLGASLGLGAVDLAVIDLALAPEVADRVEPAVVVVAAPAPLPPPVVEAAPPPPPPPPPVAAMPAEPVSYGKRVYFGTMSAVLDTRARETLDLLVADDVGFVLEGHADHRGDDSYNEKLSRKRALAVENYLVEHGVARDRIEVRHRGEVESDEDTDLWRDRRVDILVSGGSR